MPRSVEPSRQLEARAARPLAGGVATPFRTFEKPVPLFVREARGAHLVDEDANEYVDDVAGYGPVVLGHGHPGVAAAVAAAAASVQPTGRTTRASPRSWPARACA